jgi:hypothetical protein
MKAIGNTPLIRLERLPEPGCAEIYVKYEGANPTGSMKDRMALSMIEGAELDIIPSENRLITAKLEGIFGGTTSGANVWAKIDPTMKTEFRGTDGTIGFVSAWDSPNKDAGSGEQEITGINEGNRIDYEIRFFKPMKSTDKAFMSFESINDSVTKVKWGIYGKLKYPMNISFLFMDMDAMLGKDLEGGLNNLKALLEK